MNDKYICYDHQDGHFVWTDSTEYLWSIDSDSLGYKFSDYSMLTVLVLLYALDRNIKLREDYGS